MTMRRWSQCIQKSNSKLKDPVVTALGSKICVRVWPLSGIGCCGRGAVMRASASQNTVQRNVLRAKLYDLRSLWSLPKSSNQVTSGWYDGATRSRAREWSHWVFAALTSRPMAQLGPWKPILSRSGHWGDALRLKTATPPHPPSCISGLKRSFIESMSQSNCLA